MIVMQKLKFMQEFIFETNVECQHSSLNAKVPMHNCARAKHAKLEQVSRGSRIPPASVTALYMK